MHHISSPFAMEVSRVPGSGVRAESYLGLSLCISTPPPETGRFWRLETSMLFISFVTWHAAHHPMQGAPEAVIEGHTRSLSFVVSHRCFSQHKSDHVASS